MARTAAPVMVEWCRVMLVVSLARAFAAERDGAPSDGMRWSKTWHRFASF